MDDQERRRPGRKTKDGVKRRQCSVHFNVELLEWSRAYARKVGCSQPELVNAALAFYRQHVERK